MNYAESFRKKQEEIINEREREKKNAIEERKNKETDILLFFEENKKIIIEETLSTLMNKLDLEETLPYTVKHELKTSLYFGCSRNSYNDFLEHIISDEVKRRINNISCKIKVFASILTKEDGYYYLGEFWTPTSAPYRVMCIKIVLDF